MIMRWLEKLQKGASPPVDPDEMHREAGRHYLRGNRLFDQHAYDPALQEWRTATGKWRAAAGQTRRAMRRFLNLRAALAFLLTMLLVYFLLFTMLPRTRWDMVMLTGGQADNRSWWERFLDTGRPQPPGGGHKIGVREWWEGFKRRLRGEKRQQVVRRRGGRPKIDERWEKLLRRYGRYGPFFSSDLDVHLISGYGLSRLGDYSSAVEVFQDGARKTTVPQKLADLYQGLANAHYYKGYLLKKSGLARYDMEMVKKSLAAYERSVHYEPRAISFGNLGWMYFLTKEYDRAEEYSRKALAMDPTLEYVRLNLGLIHLMQDRVYDAYTIYRNFIQRNPPREVYLGGINDLREVIRDNPGRYPFAYLFVGLLSLRNGEYALARDSLNRFRLSPMVGRNWKEMAARVLRELERSERMP